MGKRSTGRKLAMQALYQADLQKVTDPSQILDAFLTEMAQNQQTADWARELTLGAFAFKDQADEIIVEYAKNWELFRLNPVDKSILRIAFFELIKGSLPTNIILNEAIEIAKAFSTDESATFINGILGNYVSSCLPES